MKLRVTIEVIEGPSNHEAPELPVHVLERMTSTYMRVQNGLSNRKRHLSFECEAEGNRQAVITLGYETT